MVMQTETTIQTDEPLHLERRRGLRIRQSRPVKVYEPVSGRYFPGQTADISTSGLRVELPASTPIGPGRTLDILIGHEGQSIASRRQMLPARVIWIDRARRGRVVAGVQYLAQASVQAEAA